MAFEPKKYIDYMTTIVIMERSSAIAQLSASVHVPWKDN